MVYVFDEIIKFSDDDFNRCFSLMPGTRQIAVNKYRFLDDRKLSVLAYLLLQIGLFREYQITSIPDYYFDNSKKPRLKHFSGIYFNMSHCKHGAACAISKREVGVDIQDHIAYEDSIGNITLSDSEVNEIINSSDSKICFTKIWTLKECYGKYSGTGILYDLKSADFSGFQENDWINRNGCLFYTMSNNIYTLSICSNEILKIKNIGYIELIDYIGTRI